MMTAPAPLAAEIVRLNDLVELLATTTDPTTGGGLAADVGSIVLGAIGGAGKAFLKTSAPNTGWSQMTQSLNWFNVRDFGAVGDDATDDRAAIQSALDALIAFGGGVLFFPTGKYRCSQNAANGYSFLLNAQNFIQIKGDGAGSIVKQAGDAASAAWSLFKITGASAYIRFEEISLDGSFVTNPTTDCHLVQVGDGASTITFTQFFSCYFGGMVAGAGDAIFFDSGNGAPIGPSWVAECVIDGAGRYGVHGNEQCNNLLVIDNYITNCTREIVVAAAADFNINVLSIIGNHILHTGTDKLAVQLVGGATALISHMVFSANAILGGFIETGNFKWTSMVGNVQTSGVYASANAAWRIFGSTVDSLAFANFIDRQSGSAIGPCLSLAASGGVSPTRFNMRGNVLAQEVAGAGAILCTDIDGATAITGNLCKGTDAGVNTAFAIELDAVTVALDNCTVSGNMILASAGSYKAGVRLLANGADVDNVLVQGNAGTQVDYGLWREIAAGGTFAQKVMHAGNNWQPAIGDVNDVGVTTPLIVGGNGGTFGAQFFQGHGSPETVITARPGSIYFNLDGGQGVSVFYKETGTAATGWLGIGGTGLVFGGGDMSAAATAVFLGAGFVQTPTATELQLAVTRPGTIRNLRVRGAGAGVGAATVTYTVRKNGVDTGLTCTVSNTAAAPWDASDLNAAHAFTVLAGDLISLSCTKSAGVVSGQTDVVASMELA